MDWAEAGQKRGNSRAGKHMWNKWLQVVVEGEGCRTLKISPDYAGQMELFEGVSIWQEEKHWKNNCGICSRCIIE